MILDVLTCLADGRQIVTQEEIPDPGPAEKIIEEP
jgi:hypothetical protein